MGTEITEEMVYEEIADFADKIMVLAETIEREYEIFGEMLKDIGLSIQITGGHCAGKGMFENKLKKCLLFLGFLQQNDIIGVMTFAVLRADIERIGKEIWG